MSTDTRQDRPVKIGIWGGPRSGKTTYIAALRTASNDPSEESRIAHGRWAVHGVGASIIYLSDMNEELEEGSFPPSTVAQHPYEFEIVGTPSESIVKQLPRFFSRFVGTPERISFTIHFLDVPGEEFRSIRDPENELWTNLADCDGLVYLFDPSAKRNFRYLVRGIDFIRQLEKAKGRLYDERLRQFIAVCISKLDLPVVFDKLDAAGLIEPSLSSEEPESSVMPFVTDARRALQVVADSNTVGTLEKDFHEDRVNYFAISSVGFYQETPGVFNRNDFRNSEVPSGVRQGASAQVLGKNAPFNEQQGSAVSKSQPDPPDQKSVEVIRGPVSPINVFTPLVWMYHAIVESRKVQNSR